MTHVEVAGASGTKRFLYDGDKLVAEYDASGNVTARYVHGAGTDEPLVWYEGPGIGDRRYLHSDERGSITSIAGVDGRIRDINSYDAWGIPALTNKGRFGYTGQIWLPELGMWYYKARIYSPTLGRFMQTDPIGYEDQVNLYAYVGNDPVNLLDATGKSCEEPEETVGRYCDPEHPEDDAPETVVTAPKPVEDRRDGADMSAIRILDVEILNPIVTLIQYVGRSSNTVCLTFNQFSDIIRNGEDTSGRIPVIGKDLTANTISLYGSGSRLGESIGSATVYRDANGNASGLYDNYNFDAKASGSRSGQDESTTRLGSYIPSKPYDIVYPCNGVN